MGFRFRRTIKIAPGVKVNLGKKGASLTVGNKLARTTFGKNRTTVSSSLPGTGISYSKQYRNKTKTQGSKKIANKGEKKMTTINISTQEASRETRNGKTSYFDGGLLQFIGWTILGSLVTVFTLGICYPWSITMIYGWKINHTVVEGRRMQFNGSAVGLFGHWIKWWVLTLITLGIYGFWVFIKLEDWKVRNTTFVK